MTLPHERMRSLRHARELLRAILHNAPMTKGELHERAGRCLKHFPTPSDLDSLAEKSPDVLSNLRSKS